LPILFLVSAALVSCGTGDSGASPTLTGAGSGSGSTPASAPSPTATQRPVEPGSADDLSIAPDFSLPNANGDPVTLSELAAEQPVVLVFYRAFW